MRSVSRIFTLAVCLWTLLPIVASAAPKDDAKALLQSAPQASQYPNAGYINLIDESKHVIKADGSWVTTTRTAMKICNERGRDAANIQLPYNSAFEKIKIIRARTIKKDGTVVELKPEEIREISPYSGYAMYSSVKAKVMIMPAVENDCIIDYEWSVSGKNSIMASHFWISWYYQAHEPIMQSKFILETPADRAFKQVSHNTKIESKVTVSKDGKTKIYVWESGAQPEINPEPHMPPLSEICPWFELSSVNSWNDIGDWYWKLIKPQMRLTPQIKNLVTDLTKGKKSDADKARAIFYWVEDNIRYVGLEFGTGAYEPHSANDVYMNKYGDCKDQATLLVTMLKSAGITAHPVLVPVGYKGSTGKRLPSPGIFDHAIGLAEIDGKQVWLDTTAEVCPFGDIPESDRGREVLIIKESGGEFVKIPVFTAEDNFVDQQVKIKLNENGGITASVAWSSEGNGELSTRATYKYSKPSKVKEGLEATASSICPGAKLIDFSLNSSDKKDEPVKVNYSFQADGWANQAGKFLIFRPSLYQSVGSQTPFTSPERKYELVFGETSVDSANTSITLPDGYKVEEIPGSIKLDTDFSSYEKTYSLNGSELVVSEKLVRKAARVPSNRYADVKKFFEDLIQAQKQQVVLRKV
ncbi:MAG: DUF3857 domain-containing transglutaminase family protein [Armatimonadota bacterium]